MRYKKMEAEMKDSEYRDLFKKTKTAIEVAEVMYNYERSVTTGGGDVKKEIAINTVLNSLNIPLQERASYYGMISDMIDGMFDIYKNGIGVNKKKHQTLCFKSLLFCFSKAIETKEKKPEVPNH